MTSFSFLFFDMNSFYASVAQAEEPRLRGRPVGVLTTDEPGAACIAASIEAKRCGVRMGTRRWEAVQLCPGIVFRAVKHDVCVDYHHRIRDAVETVLPIHRAFSIDEFACRLTGSQQRLPVALDLARQVQAVIRARVNPALNSSVGVAPTRLLAKIAAGLEKPGGIHWLAPEVLPGRIAHLATDDIPGISTRMKLRLDQAGIPDVPTLYATDPKAARLIWGNVTGERLLRELRGEDVVWPDTRRAMIGHGQVLSGPNATPEGARLVGRRLLVKAAARLRREDFVTRALTVQCRDGRDRYTDAQSTFPATQDTIFLLQRFETCWARMTAKRPAAVHVILSDLLLWNERVPDLFDPLPADARSARERLCLMIDGLNRRYGQDTIRFGQLPRHRVPYTGAKIAFGRIPDAADFRE